MSPTITLPNDGIVRIIPWHDPATDTHGYDVRSPYVETFWLGVLGPTAMWLMRRCADGLSAYPDGVDMDLHELAGGLGLGFVPGKHGPFVRGFHRCVMFGMAYQVATLPVLTLAVRTIIPPLPMRHAARLPDGLRTALMDWHNMTPTMSM
jgi:hypothetical protein